MDLFGELKLVDACLKEVEPQHVIMQAAFEPEGTSGTVCFRMLVDVAWCFWSFHENMAPKYLFLKMPLFNRPHEF